MKRISLIISILWLLCTAANAQDRLQELSYLLDSLATRIPELHEEVELSLQDVPLHDYVRAIGQAHRINVYIADQSQHRISTSLSGEPVKSVFLFICKTFSYTIEPVGSILHFIPYKAPLPTPVQPPPYQVNIQFDAGLLSADLQNDDLSAVIRKISEETDIRILTRPNTEGKISAFLPPTELNTALNAIFTTNGFRLQEDDGIYIISSIRSTIPNTPPPPQKQQGTANFRIELYEEEDILLVSLEAERASLSLLIDELFRESKEDFRLLDDLQGVVDMHTEAIPFDELLQSILQGSPYSFRKEGSRYVIGAKQRKSIQETRIFKLKYRPVEQVISLIPKAMQQEVELIEYQDLNRIIATAESHQLAQIEQFILEIDRPIPMVKVEMLVVEVDRNRYISTGIKAGFGNPDSSGGGQSLLPGVNYTADGSELNNLLLTSGIPALQGLGTLSSNFYLQVKAQENRGNLKVKMQPVLSMLNGKEASLTIGQTQYYLLETQTNSTGAVSNFQQATQRFEKIEANVTLSIKPHISDDGMVTLDIIPDFSTPIGSLNSDVPPTIATRKFNSSIRVKDGETVILGGLTREEQSESTSGLPLISRLPVLKWLFGNVDRSKSSSSLLIYITPSIEYY